MNRNDLYTAFNAVDNDILERSETSGFKIIPIRRRLPVALIAAILALVLMGAGVVAIVYGDSIQSWFGHYWEQVTGQPMSDQHTALIDHLSQEIDLAQTVGDVTVTVDFSGAQPGTATQNAEITCSDPAVGQTNPDKQYEIEARIERYLPTN